MDDKNVPYYLDLFPYYVPLGFGLFFCISSIAIQISSQTFAPNFFLVWTNDIIFKEVL